MMINLLYIDDDEEYKVAPFYDLINNEKLHIEYMQVSEWGSTIDNITSTINERAFSGLILDWQLNLNTFTDKDGQKKRAKYKAAEVAQFVRRSVIEKEIRREVPLFVWSLEDRLVDSYDKDNTSHDLFDKIYLKRGNPYSVSDNPDYVRQDMLDFVETYDKVSTLLNENSFTYENFINLLSVNIEEDYGIDETVFDYLLGIEKELSTRLVTKFLHDEIVSHSGLLVNESLLAVRLGIDIEKSEDWQVLLKKISAYVYKGLFANSELRFWMRGIYSYWVSISPKKPDINNLDAETRVSILKESLGLINLVPITNDKNNGVYYWNICESSGVALDPDDSIMIREPDPLFWQERRYISTYVARNDLGRRKGLVPHIVEKYKLEF